MESHLFSFSLQFNLDTAKISEIMVVCIIFNKDLIISP